MHLPLLAPGGGLSRLRVGSETRETCAGRALVFDDSFEHEAWNDGDGDGDGDDRCRLVFDFGKNALEKFTDCQNPLRNPI